MCTVLFCMQQKDNHGRIKVFNVNLTNGGGLDHTPKSTWDTTRKKAKYATTKQKRQEAIKAL